MLKFEVYIFESACVCWEVHDALRKPVAGCGMLRHVLLSHPCPQPQISLCIREHDRARGNWVGNVHVRDWMLVFQRCMHLCNTWEALTWSKGKKSEQNNPCTRIAKVTACGKRNPLSIEGSAEYADTPYIRIIGWRAHFQSSSLRSIMYGVVTGGGCWVGGTRLVSCVSFVQLDSSLEMLSITQGSLQHRSSELH